MTELYNKIKHLESALESAKDKLEVCRETIRNQDKQIKTAEGRLERCQLLVNNLIKETIKGGGDE